MKHQKLLQQQRGCHVPCILVYRVLKRCIQMKNLALGRRIHAVTVRSMYKGDAFLATHLIGLYASHGRLKEAMEVFAEVPVPDAYNWAAIILAHARHVETGNPAEAIRLYRQMCKSTAIRPDDRLYSAVLKACAAAKDLIAGKEVHSHILASAGQPDKFVQAGLVNMYAKCGSLDDARNIFDKLSDKNVVTWTAMIAGYAQQGKGQDALSLYRSMQSEDVTPPDSVTYVCLLQACASVGVGALGEGKELHRQIKDRHLEDDVIVGGSLVNMYAKCGRLKEARSVFDKLPNKHVVTWTALIAGYAQHGLGEDALSLFSSMQRKGLTPPDSVTYVCLLQACASVGAPALEKGKQLHAQIREGGRQDDAILGGSLVNMYVKCGSLEEARIVFDKLSNRGVVTWTAMITGYAQEGMGQEALSLYRSMQQEGFTPPDTVIYGCLLQACAAAAALPMGEKLHAEMEERGMPVDGSVGAALVNMYAKCGSMCASQTVFDSLSERSLEAWGALVSGYARQGESQVVFDLLDRMRLEGVNPDEITFLSVLTVCSHAGLVDEGRKYFEAMRRDYGIRPATKHYICMVDLLGRAGHLHEALQMAKSMPFPATDVVWLTLLGACQKWRDVEIGQLAFQGAISVDERNSAAYVLMSNIYASTAMWEAAEKMQTRRMKFGARKEPGQSWWTDMGGVVHTLCVRD